MTYRLQPTFKYLVFFVLQSTAFVNYFYYNKTMCFAEAAIRVLGLRLWI